MLVYQNLPECICKHEFHNFSVSLQAERQAVNTTVQGSAADIVKLATVNIQKRLRKTYPAAPLSHQHTHSGDLTLNSSFPILYQHNMQKEITTALLFSL